VIAVTTTSITLGAALLMRIVDRDEFPTIGGSLWWAVQTVTTVGYGDHVPASTGGRLVAALVMLQGIGLVTVITASITSSFVAGFHGHRHIGDDAPAAVAKQLHEIDARLARIEAAVAERET